MKILSALLSIFRAEGDDAVMLDHVPVASGRRTVKQTKALVERAKKRHGKQFKTHTQVGRCEPSRFLSELNALTEPKESLVIVPANVTTLLALKAVSK